MSYKKILLRLLIKLLKSSTAKEPDELKREVANLFTLPLEQIIEIFLSASPDADKEIMLEQLITKETPIFLMRAQDIAKRWQARKQHKSGLLNHSSKPHKLYDNDQSE